MEKFILPEKYSKIESFIAQFPNHGRFGQLKERIVSDIDYLTGSDYPLTGDPYLYELAGDLVRLILLKRRVSIDLKSDVYRSERNALLEMVMNTPGLNTMTEGLKEVFDSIASGNNLAASELLKQLIEHENDRISNEQSRRARSPRKDNELNAAIREYLLKHKNATALTCWLHLRELAANHMHPFLDDYAEDGYITLGAKNRRIMHITQEAVSGRIKRIKQKIKQEKS